MVSVGVRPVGGTTPRLLHLFAGLAAGLAAIAGLSGEAGAGECRADTFEDAAFTVCRYDLAADDVRIVWRGKDGAPYRTFDALSEALTADSRSLAFAMNGGMYDEEFRPIGLHVEDGETLSAANAAKAPPDVKPVPNFYKEPNGVFLIDGDAAAIVTTADYLAKKPAADFATQSGPMLFVGGRINPIFIVGSSDRKRRNGVGVGPANVVHLVIADDAVNFHDFARFFKERLGVTEALFLDGGSAPAIYAPEFERNDPPGHGGLGPIIAVVR